MGNTADGDRPSDQVREELGSDSSHSDVERNLLNTFEPSEERFYLGSNYPNIYFTRREMDCARELLKGKTMKEIGKEMGISHRSVELYLKHMRFKLSVNTKHELFCAIRDKTEIKGQIDLGVYEDVGLMKVRPVNFQRLNGVEKFNSGFENMLNFAKSIDLLFIK